MPAIGFRIGALLKTDDKKAYLIGYGTYQGHEVPPKEIGGFNFGLPNPKLVMDDGTVVWGCECWWGPVDLITARIGDREVVNVDINAERERAKAALADET